MSSRALLRLTAAAFLGTLVAACGNTPPAPAATDLPDLRRDHLPEDVVQKLLTVRNTYAAYHSFEAAQDAEFTIKITECMVSRPHGGMGYHYGKGALLDGTPDELAPEVLLYEPVQPSGMRLIGVEYVVPFDQWQGSEPPELFGLQMKRNETFQVWALHAWLFKDNPQGVFADWNPRVNCPPVNR